MQKYLSIEDFIESQDPEITALLWSLRHTILNAHPKMKERFMFNTAMFGVKNELCYFVIMKKNSGVEVGFHRGFQMSNIQGLLEAKKRQFIQSVSFKNAEDLQEKLAAFKEILQEAIILDEINDKSIFSEILQKGRKK
ncbi:DUF1801 domain-containing protein [Emticicia sp. SJ17W-69]|uniref:DUF1801 domain-containing protein n=1 Tax=Emticicia sp. SJ17W-69 TaxID=3421657 RepID=UPI003EBC6873